MLELTTNLLLYWSLAFQSFNPVLRSHIKTKALAIEGPPLSG